MKGVLLVAALLVAGGIYFLGHFGTIAAPILAHIQLLEGSVDDIQNAAQEHPRGFAVRYKPFLDQRYWLARVAQVMDDGTFLAVAQDTYDRYNGTPLADDLEFAFLLVNEGQLLAQRQRFQDAANLYEQYMQSFPQGPDEGLAQSSLANLRINYGVQ